MKPIAAIVESEINPHAAAVDKAMQRIRDAEQHLEQCEARTQTARDQLARARLELGRALVDARKLWPRTGPRAKGWSDFLAVRRLTLDAAQDAMLYAGYVESVGRDVSDNLPTRREAGLDTRPLATDRDAAPANVPPPQLALVPPPATEPEVEIDRDTWCTPAWLTSAIGEFFIDPCSNSRSTVRASVKLALDDGIDGLAHAEDVAPHRTTFINPPYSDVPPWIAAYGHTRFCFLLKLDTSTRWFADLFARTQLILIPRKRIQFDPPPGVPPERAIAQQFPHALFYARAEDATPEIRALCWAWRVDLTT